MKVEVFMCNYIQFLAGNIESYKIEFFYFPNSLVITNKWTKLHLLFIHDQLVICYEKLSCYSHFSILLLI